MQILNDKIKKEKINLALENANYKSKQSNMKWFLYLLKGRKNYKDDMMYKFLLDGDVKC